MNYIFVFFKIFIFINLSILYKQDITKGITKIINNVELPVIFNANENCFNIISSGNIYVVNKGNKSIKYQKSIPLYLPPFLLYVDKSKNYYLLTENSRYKVLLNESNEIVDLESVDLISQINQYYLGYFIEKDSSQSISNEFGIKESIIYGLNENGIYFYSTSKDKLYNFEYINDGNIDDKSLSCEEIENNYFICIFYLGYYLELKIINCNNDKCDEISSSDNLFESYDDGIIYNTLEINMKLVCGKVSVSNQIDCVNILINDNYKIIKNDFFSLPIKYNSDDCDIKYCNFINFLSEYLFCCSCNNYIICTRITLDFTIKDNFILYIEGQNSFLKIINNINYLSILFLNGNNIYIKNIYPPNCKNISKDIVQEIEIDITEFFDIKIESNHFLLFEDFNSEILTIKLNEKIIDASSEINLNSESNFDEISFKFILINENLENNVLNIIYKIRIEETYSSICSINFIINHSYNNIETQNNIIDESSY